MIGCGVSVARFPPVLIDRVQGDEHTRYAIERSSGNVMASLKSLVPSLCRVIRDGKVRRIQAAELVVGDLVQLKGGDRVRWAKFLQLCAALQSAGHRRWLWLEITEFRMPAGKCGIISGHVVESVLLQGWQV